jgi:predicted dehydrogenase/nucleoside-diphosphate-sugar epimerase
MSDLTPGPKKRSGASLTARANTGPAKRRVALLGAGYIADWHALALQSVAGVELVAVCDRFVSKAQALARKFSVAGAYESLDEMLAAESAKPGGLDAVHVLTPPDHHFEPARVVLEAGVNVFLEKPMCASAEDCDELVRLAEGRGFRLGVGHNFLFADHYERLREDVKSGVLGLIDDVTITWNRPLPQAIHGPFDAWMLRDPRNILIEVGSHSVAHLLDLLGEPDESEARPSNATELPTGVKFYRHWQVNALRGRTAIELRFSFVPGFAEYTIHVRGSLSSATVDFERNTYTLDEHRPSDLDFENYGIVVDRAKTLKRQARRTLATYIKSKLKLGERGNPYGASIARAMDAFYGALPLDERVSGRMGARVIRLCEKLGAQANFPEEKDATKTVMISSASAVRILVLGGTGFIGKELLRQLVEAGHTVRVLVRNEAAIPRELSGSGKLECVVGNIANKPDLLRAMKGIETVFHLARANVKTWADYQELEIEATRRVGECALASGVKRLVYTGTIDSYYCGASAGTITEQTPLDPQIERRNLYARAKAASEAILMRMHREQGLPVVIVRPGIVIGRGGSPFHWGVGMWWNDAVCQVWGDGKNKLALVLVEDVATGLIAAMETASIEGRSFNLVGDPMLTAQEYLDALDKAGGIRIQRHATSIARFYLLHMMKWLVKVAVRHPERRMPSYRDWEGRTGRAVFDCSAAKNMLGWKPVSDREELVRRGIEEPFEEYFR